MNLGKATDLIFIWSFLLSSLLVFASTSIAANVAPIVGDFSDSNNTSLGFPRYL